MGSVHGKRGCASTLESASHLIPRPSLNRNDNEQASGPVHQARRRRLSTMRTTPTAVCFVVENLPVPLDRRVWREACALRAAGYRVSVICPKGKGWTAGYETIEGIEVYRHKAWEASGIAGYLLEYTAALASELFLT